MPALQFIDYAGGITALDAGYVRPWLAAVHLIVQDGRAAIVDTGSNASVARILAALRLKGLAPEQVDYVVLTHIHLDHAGGAGLLMAQLPVARLCVHPRGARHVADPGRLMRSTIEVYGAECARALYGEIVPVPAARIDEIGEGTSIALAGRVLRFIDTPGHARHHCCMLDASSGSVFAGDTFGLAYRELATDGRRSVFPTTSPVQFEPEALHASIERIVALEPAQVFVTHFGGLRDMPRLAADLHRLIDAHVAIAKQYAGDCETRHASIKACLEELLRAEAKRQGWRLGDAALQELFATDIELNAQGLGVWLDSQATAAARPAS